MKLFEMFPKSEIRNIAIYYIITVLTHCWFVEGNWFFFWTKFVSVLQVGTFFAISTAYGLLLEIPTGAIADRFGRRRTVILALISQALGIGIVAISSSFWMLVVGGLIHETGMAFLSGALEALAYDSLKETDEEGSYPAIAAKTDQIAIVVTAVTIVMGGVMYLMNYRLPYMAWAATLTMAAITALKLKEISGQKEEEQQRYLTKLKDGVKYLFSGSLRPYLILILVIMGVYYLYDWGVIKPAMSISFGFYDKEQAVVYALFAVLGTLVLGQIDKIRRWVKNDIKGVRLMGVIMAIGFGLAALKLGWWGFGAMLLIELSATLAYPWISIVVNKEVPSAHRATTLSAVAFITKLPYVVSIVLISGAIQEGRIGIVNAIIALIMILGIVSGRWYERKRLAILG